MPIDPAFTTFSLSDYGRRYTLPIPGARDGYAYRVDLYQRGYAGSVRTLRGGRRPARFRLGDRGSSAQFLAASSLEISVLEQYVSDLRQTISSDAWEWAMVLRRGTQGSEPTTIIWTGLVNAQTLTQKPREKVNEVSVRAYGGLGVLDLDGVTFNAMDDEPQGAQQRVVDVLIRALRMVSDRNELRTGCNWYPWRDGSEVSGDPLAALFARSDLWNGKRAGDEPGNIYGPYQAIAEVAKSFGLEVFQGFDGWYAIQPIEAPDWSRYDFGTDTFLGTTPATEIDVSGWSVRRGSIAEAEAPISTIGATYSFEEEEANIVEDSSFEGSAAAWTVTNSAVVGARSGSVAGEPDGPFPNDSSDDLQCLKMEAFNTFIEFSATQSLRVATFAHPLEMRVSYDFISTNDQLEFVWEMTSGDDIQFVQVPLQVMRDAQNGPDSEVRVAWPGDPNNTNSFIADLSIYGDRPMIPAGAELAVVRGELWPALQEEITLITVEEDVYPNDPVITAEVGEDIEAFPDGQPGAFILAAAVVPIETDVNGTPTVNPVRVRKPAGVLGTGRLHCYVPPGVRTTSFDVRLGRSFESVPAQPPTSDDVLGVDHFRVELLASGDTLEGISFTATAPEVGRTESIPGARLGDGPGPDSPGALRFSDGTPTIQQQGVGWKNGTWAAGETANFRNLVEHSAIEFVRGLRQGIETETLDLYLPEGHSWSPAAVIIAPDPDGGTRRLWRRSIDWDIQAGVASVTAREIYKGSASDIDTAFGVETRSSGSGGSSSRPVFGGGGGGTSGVFSFNGRTGSVTLEGADVENALGYVPLPDGPFSIEDGGGGTLLSLDSDGNLAAAGDVVAFSSGSGGAGSGGGTAFQAGRSVELDTSTDPATLDVTLVAGTNVSLATDANGNYVISSSGGGSVDAPVDSVFGRTGVVEAESGDYSAGQITGFDVAAGQAGLQAVNTAFEITPDRIAYDIGQIATPSGGQIRMFATDDGTTAEWRILGRTSGFSTHAPIVSLYNGSGYTSLTVTPTDLEVNQNRVWHDANVQASDITGALGYTPIASGPFSILDGSGGTLLALDADGNLEAAGDLIAFASGSGSGSGSGGTAFQAGRSVELDTGTDPATLDVTLVAGSNVSLSTDASGNYVISAAGGGGGAVDSVFGRTGIVTAQSGDYSAGQISGFDTAAVSAVELQGSLSVDIDGEAGSVAWSNVLGRPALVNSFNGRAGSVSPQSGDYSASQISGFDTAVRGVSNLDADTLGGVSPSTYARLDQREEFTDGLSVTGGPFMVGTTTSSFAAEVRGDMRVQVNTNPASGGAIFSVLSSGGSERLRVEHDGQTSTSNSFRASGAITSGGEIEAFTSSDRRQKRKIVPIQNARSVLQTLSPVGYYYNDRAPEHRRGRRAYGLLAQEVQRVIPEAVRRGPDGYLQLDYQQVIPYLVAAIREQQKEIDALTKRG